MSTTTVHVERRERLALVTIDRPPLNVLDIATNQLLLAELEQLASDDQLAVVAIRGAGPKAFSAGVAIEDHTAEQLPTMLGTFHQVVRRLAGMEAVTIAAVHGHCLGGGFELATACDLVLATEGARFALPEIKLACYPPVAAAWWPRRIGFAATLDLALTGRPLSAAEAQRRGLVSRLCPSDQLEAALESLVEELLASSTPVLRLGKRAARVGLEQGPGAALDECERLYLEELTEVADMHEGVAAFFEKRPASWRHR